MNTVEDRLRDALRERADHSPVSSDAWERVLARARRRRGLLSSGHAWQARYVIPALAAAAVAGIIIAANVVTGQLPSSSTTPGGGNNPSTASPPPSGVTPQLGIGRLSRQVPPSSAILSYEYAPEGTKIFAASGSGTGARSSGSTTSARGSSSAARSLTPIPCSSLSTGPRARNVP